VLSVALQFVHMAVKVYVSYDEVHRTLARVAQTVKDSFKPDFIIAIGGGGFIPCVYTSTQY
jgi:hypoxanthine phosphoribosyltransferase